MKVQEVGSVQTGEETVYDRSFAARIAQADDTVREYYNTVKEELLSYRGVKSRLSWTADSFNKGRDKLAKLQIKGKTLVLYLALDPNEVESRYHVMNVSDIDKYSAVPTKLRIRNPRSLKHAKELVAQLMEKMTIAKSTRIVQFDRIAAMTTEELIAAGLIKCKQGTRPDFWGKTGD